MPIQGPLVFSPYKVPFKRRRNHKGVLYFRKIPELEKQQFKSVATKRGDSMQDVIRALMRLYNKKPDIVEKELRKIKKEREE